jgi:hypothetical protein
MSAELAIRNVQPDTGASYCEWYTREFSRPLTGQSYPSLVLMGCDLDRLATFESAIIFDISMDSGISGLSVLDSVGNLDDAILSMVVTDPGAQNRLREHHLVEWSKNLAHLSAVAQEIIPELRPMTAPERRSLGKYYNKLYRKI